MNVRDEVTDTPANSIYQLEAGARREANHRMIPMSCRRRVDDDLLQGSIRCDSTGSRPESC
jgi:hypothetical protein